MQLTDILVNALTKRSGDAKIDDLADLHANHQPPKAFLKVSMTRSATGVPITISRHGNMKRASGIDSRTGRRAARSSMRIMRSVRISAARMRIDSASGVPKRIA